MPTEELLKLAQTYGLGMFLSMAMLIGMCFLVRWILLSNDKRETRCDAREKAHTDIINVGMAAVTSNLQTVTQTLGNLQTQQMAASAAGQARYDIFMKAQEMQRIEHASMLEKISGIHVDVKEIECKALVSIQKQ